MLLSLHRSRLVAVYDWAMTTGGNRDDNSTFKLPSPLGGAIGGAFLLVCFTQGFGPVISIAAALIGGVIGAMAEMIYLRFERN